jgi:hypothetical protein
VSPLSGYIAWLKSSFHCSNSWSVTIKCHT